jgi:hypothetical protein
MKIPKIAKVGPLLYDIVEKKKVGPKTKDGSIYFGFTKHEKQSIAINKLLRDGLKRETLLHELLHCCVLQSGLQCDYDEEERIVASLSPLILQVLRDNEDIVEYLLNG